MYSRALCTGPLSLGKFPQSVDDPSKWRRLFCGIASHVFESSGSGRVLGLRIKWPNHVTYMFNEIGRDMSECNAFFGRFRLFQLDFNRILHVSLRNTIAHNFCINDDPIYSASDPRVIKHSKTRRCKLESIVLSIHPPLRSAHVALQSCSAPPERNWPFCRRCRILG